MVNDWDRDRDALSLIKVFSNSNNAPVTINSVPDNLQCIGRGTDAAVFHAPSNPAYAFKIYAEDVINKVAIESAVYQKLDNSPFFPTYYAAHDNYLVLSYEAGPTLFDCLLKGVHIAPNIITQVEEARAYIKTKGLNPRDIHLKNIILQNGSAKIIDVSEYIRTGDDYRWAHLKQSYEQYYPLIDGKAMPYWLVETIRKSYIMQRKKSFSFEDFAKSVLDKYLIRKS